jgi:hypothetical protein
MYTREARELEVITKTYDLILWSVHHTSRFPRNHRFVLGERMERRLYELLEVERPEFLKRAAAAGLGVKEFEPGWMLMGGQFEAAA